MRMSSLQRMRSVAVWMEEDCCLRPPPSPWMMMMIIMMRLHCCGGGGGGNHVVCFVVNAARGRLPIGDAQDDEIEARSWGAGFGCGG
jgi:hypothetical protein